MSIIDTPWNTSKKLPCLAGQGVTTIIRYYNFSNSSTLPEKALTLQEAEAISAAGMKIGVVFQQRQNSAANFSEIKGYEAGRQAYRYASNSIGQPEDSAIYFSVDFDATAKEVDENIAPYFEGVRRAFNEVSNGNPVYTVGVYGSGAVGKALRERQLCTYIWLAMSKGFRGTKAALESGDYDLEQRTPETIVCGLDVDQNFVNPAKSDFGTFTLSDVSLPAAIPTAVAPPQSSATLGRRYKVIARSSLRLREGPGTQHEVVGRLYPQQIVFANPVSESWSSIDIEGDGLIDGFASADYLLPVTA